MCSSTSPSSNTELVKYDLVRVNSQKNCFRSLAEKVVKDVCVFSLEKMVQSQTFVFNTPCVLPPAVCEMNCLMSDCGSSATISSQVIICGRQVMCSYLTQDIELRVVQHYVGPDSQTVVKEHCDCLQAGAKLPSYVLEDAEMTELCVRHCGDEDWSQDVQLERRDKGSSNSVVQVWQEKLRCKSSCWARRRSVCLLSVCLTAENENFQER